MSGFPTRLTRSALGPTLRDAYPVENPETDIGAKTFEAAFWQLAGSNLIVPRSVVIAKWNTGTVAFDKAHEAQAWNPNGSQAAPTLARTSAGVYTYTFLASYTDETGAAVAFSPVAPRISAFPSLAGYANRVSAHAWIDTNPLVIQVRLWDGSGTATDAPFWLETF